MTFRYALFAKAVVFTVIFSFSKSAIAQLSALPSKTHEHWLAAHPSSIHAKNDSVKLEDQQFNYTSNRKFYYNLASVFASLKLYPLAMKCFFKALRVNKSDDDRLGGLSLTANDTIVNLEKKLLKSKQKSRKSQRIKFKQILHSFNDGKTAIAYAFLFHVKQPAPGKPKIFVGVNTGHTFITLIKYNSDSTYISASFGFYPSKNHLLSASPIFPTTGATFKDDAIHLWDEVVGKFISKHKFERILALTSRYEGLVYNLNRQNCTDFGLQAASLAGIRIAETSGKWPLGMGNNPAVTGQSILTRNVANEADPEEELFIDDFYTR